MKTFLNEIDDLYPNGMLKVDVKICETYMPNEKVTYYTLSDFKTVRHVVFENNTMMMIETKDINGEIWKQTLEVFENSNYKINLINKIVDKDNRTIYIFNFLDNKIYNKR